MTSLTRVLINPRRRGAAKLLTNPEAMHAAVRAAFPPDLQETEEAGRVLWRVDKRDERWVLYIVGPERPDAINIVEQAGWSTRPPESTDYGRFLNGLGKGQRWYFELVANPVVSRVKEGSARGKRVPLTGNGQLEWLIGGSQSSGVSRAEAAGFRITYQEDTSEPNVKIIGSEALRFRKRPGGAFVSLSTARYQGVLEITDTGRMRNTLINGIGYARAYGCGLLTLARP